MLGNIASDLDTLLTDLCQVNKDQSSKEDLPCTSGTVHSADTLGKDSFFSSTGDTSRRQGDAISSNHSLVSLSDNDHNDCDSVDSGHDGRCRSGPSPLVFDPHHFGPLSNQCSPAMTERVEISYSMDDLRPISTVERLIKTNSIWLLATMSRAGAVHILKDRETGIFIVRKSSKPSTLALSVQSRLSDHPTVDHYLIEGSNYGLRLQGSAHFFNSIPALIAYYVENIDEIPYHLLLPSAIQQARSTRELASLDMLGQDFWVSSLSRKPLAHEVMSRILHKSCSEPINIQRPVQVVTTNSEQATHKTIPSKSASDFSHFMRTQLEMEQYFKQHLHDCPTEGFTADILDNGSSFHQSRNDSNLETSLVSCKSQVIITPPAGETAVASDIIQTFSQRCRYSKEITQNSVVSGLSSHTSNQESPQLISHAQQLNRLASKCSWELASSPIVSTKQNLMFNQSAQDVDLYRSNPSNEPLDVEDGFTSAQQLMNKSDSSNMHFIKDIPLVSLNNLQSAQESITKERSWTHPGSVPKVKSNLYFTTNLDLLDIPENSYFTSNLSDKLSDYEDIWKNSCCESDVDRKNLKMIHDPRAILDARVNSHIKKSVIEGKRKVLRKTSKDSPPVRRPIPRSRDAVTGGTTGLTALEQARMIAGSTSEDESSIPVAHVTGIRRMENMFEDEPLPLDTSSTSTASTTKPEIFTSERNIGSIQIPAHQAHQIKFVTSHSLDFAPKCELGTSIPEDSSSVPSSKHVSSQSSMESASKCVFTTTMSVIVSESTSSEHSPNINKNKKGNKLPLGHLSRMKSSSESSLATVSSPLYAEPADAVQLRDKNGKAISIQVRRLSASWAASLKIKNSSGKDQQTKVSQLPQLDTIFSPDAQSSNNNISQSKFLFETSSNKILTKNVGVSRSQSMRTTSEMSNLQSKQSWKDRLNRLKLGTKVLTQNRMQQTAPSFKKNMPIILHHRDLDSALFHDLPLVETSSAAIKTFPGKFPVDHQQELHRTSYFSESSTVQDLISCSHPELSVRPIAAKFMKPDDKTGGTPPSEYDNLLVYRASTHSSLGTVYSPPWEVGTVNKLIRESPTPSSHNLPPAMDIIERIERWQQTSSSYHGINVIDDTLLTKNKNTQTHHSGHSENDQLMQRQQQLLDHQQQIKIDDSNRAHGFHRHLNSGSVRQYLHDSNNTDLSQQQHKAKNRLNPQDSGTIMASPPSSPQITNIAITTTSSEALSSPHRLSSHCPDVVHCHNSSANQNFNSSEGIDYSTKTSGQRCKEKDDFVDRNLKQTKSRTIQAQQKPGSHCEWRTPGTKIREYIFKLSRDRKTIFGSTIENFIQCTMESQETNPQYVMRNVRQFMTGIKNYLVKHGEGELENLIEIERSKLGANEIFNIDTIIEQALHICVLKPLKYHIYRLFVEKYNKNGALEQLSKNIKYARTKSAQDIGVKPGLKLPQNIDLEVIKHYLNLMQRSYSPLQKLQNLLNAMSTIYHSVQGSHHQFPSRSSSLGAEDFLPILIYVIVHCGLVSAEIEADFMWGLLQPSLLTGEGGYYLTTLSSAVLILKNFQETHQLVPAQLEGQLPTLSDMQGFLKIAIPDELHGSITWKTLPVRPNMNTRDVCAMVAHKFKITNPQDYGLYLLCDGLENHLADSDCPQIIKGDSLALGKSCYFTFKRLDANIAWPKHMKNSPHN